MLNMLSMLNKALIANMSLYFVLCSPEDLITIRKDLTTTSAASTWEAATSPSGATPTPTPRGTSSWKTSAYRKRILSTRSDSILDRKVGLGKFLISLIRSNIDGVIISIRVENVKIFLFFQKNFSEMGPNDDFHFQTYLSNT